MRARHRWLLALLGAAVIVSLTLGLFLFANWLGEEWSHRNCLDHQGSWDYTEQRCYLPRQTEDR